MPRLCYALDLHDDPALIAEYERWHRPDTIWPEIVESIRAAGIRELEIHRSGDRLVLIMDVEDDYDPAVKSAADASNPAVQAWEELMWKFQEPLPGSPPGEKWSAMRRIFALSDFALSDIRAGTSTPDRE
ncbi:L-rhamnose mutarotase [Lysobacter sp. CA199]|uniref:L-rhamnose mutarotase n=1 Tax=Lysobacter sp. CA199 TaxID=3455608 RepID=UPI003F8D4498